MCFVKPLPAVLNVLGRRPGRASHLIRPRSAAERGEQPVRMVADVDIAVIHQRVTDVSASRQVRASSSGLDILQDLVERRDEIVWDALHSMLLTVVRNELLPGLE